MVEQSVYLDNSATTKPSEASLNKMREALHVCYANPGSVHHAGNEARRLLEEARTQVGRTMGIRRPADGQIVFTSGGTEANNLAIFGSVRAKSRPEKNGSRGKVFITDGEHASVENAAAQLAAEGFTILRIPTRGGELDLSFVEEHADSTVILAAMMLVNNETGALYDFRRAADLIRERSPRAVIHCDAVQAYLRQSFTPATLGADTIAVSAHKIYAPKGAGALYISREMVRGKRIVPCLYGGGQEDGLRSGTENVPAIAALGAAAAEGLSELTTRQARIAQLRSCLVEKIAPIVRINVPACHTDAIINITLPDIKSETMLNELSGKGFYISAGSACSARAGHVSRALLAYGLSQREADCSLRISLSHHNTEEELTAFAAALADGVGRLARIR